MTRPIHAIILLAITLTSCEKYLEDPQYPTTLKILSTEEYSQLKESFALKNKYLKSSVNEFGFCDLTTTQSVDSPPLLDLNSEEETISIAKSFILKNPSETGINNPEDISIYSFSRNSIYGGAIRWVLKLSHQQIDTVEVMHSDCIIHITSREVTHCIGNWYPNIYIPSEFNLTQSKAKSALIGKVVTHYSIGGEKYSYTISKQNLANSHIHLKILPKVYEDKIELRICWQIYVPDVSYILYVDVMNGEIVNQEPTIIS